MVRSRLAALLVALAALSLMSVVALTSPTGGPGGRATPRPSAASPAPALAGAGAGGPVLGSGPPGPAGAWHLVFRDDFNGTALDPRRWRSGMWYDPQGGGTIATNHELEWYSPSALSVRNGLLTLTATQHRSEHDGHTFEYLSGMATTGPEAGGTPKFDFRFGYVEARMKLPSGRGLWPAFWTLNSRPPSVFLPEIDIMELLGHQPTVVQQHYHWSHNGADQAFGGESSVSDASRSFHTYGMDWSPQSIRWYVDGHLVLTFADRTQITAQPMYLLLNLAVGGDWPGPPDASTVFPATMQVDWVAVWQR